jgi:predicted enzyme related to lactoylglutathione lyase
VSIDNELISAARAALGQPNGEQAEQLYDDLIAAIEAHHKGDQREVAATLGQLAKTLNEESPDKAMQFKQRTTEIMLKRSMAARMAERQLPRMQNQPTMQSPPPPLPFKQLEYLYMGCSDFDRDLKYYTEVLGAHLLWAFDKFDAKVAALRVASGTPILLATHRPAPSCQPIFSVASLEAAAENLKKRGWTSEGEAVETPNGRAYIFQDPSGNPLAILQNERPDALERAYADKTNEHAIRPGGTK